MKSNSAFFVATVESNSAFLPLPSIYFDRCFALSNFEVCCWLLCLCCWHCHFYPFLFHFFSLFNLFVVQNIFSHVTQFAGTAIGNHSTCILFCWLGPKDNSNTSSSMELQQSLACNRIVKNHFGIHFGFHAAYRSAYYSIFKNKLMNGNTMVALAGKFRMNFEKISLIRQPTHAYITGLNCKMEQ